jgi:hypothetical protein
MIPVARKIAPAQAYVPAPPPKGLIALSTPAKLDHREGPSIVAAAGEGRLAAGA